MPGKIPETIILFRLIHIDNVEHVLLNGICSKQHPKANPAYINIGDSGLIANRNTYSVKIVPPGGLLGEYVPFYFGVHSPMLLKIKDGYGGVVKRPQSDIIYVICKMNRVIQKCGNWCFTDGHAKNALTDFYNHIDHLDKIDWNMVGAHYWRNTEDDFDRMRRKQAEFLVKDHVPVFCIHGIATYDKEVNTKVESMVAKAGLTLPVLIKKSWYY